MKALQLVPAMAEGGVERYACALNRMLVAAGWENAVVSWGGRLDAEIVADGGRALHLDLKSKNPLSVPWRAWRLRRLLKREKPDVVCVHSRVPGWLFKFASAGLGLPHLTFAHGANSVSRYSRIMTEGAVTICPSRFVADYLRAAYGLPEERFAVIPHALDAARFDPDNLDAAFVAEKRREWRLEGRRVAMAVGRITRLKGYDTLLRAFAGILHSNIRTSQHPNLSLVIVGGAEKGKEDLLAELQGLARELGVADRVIFAGSQAKVPECLSLADVVVSSNTQKPESFGLSMAEALAMDKPVVAKAFGGALDIVRDGLDGRLVATDAEPVAGFAAAISEVLQKSAEHGYAGLRASALARFDAATCARRTLAVFSRVAGE